MEAKRNSPDLGGARSLITLDMNTIVKVQVCGTRVAAPVTSGSHLLFRGGLNRISA